MSRSDDSKIKTGEINAAGILDEIYHFLFRVYELQVNPGAVKKALQYLNSNIGEEKTRKAFIRFYFCFPAARSL